MVCVFGVVAVRLALTVLLLSTLAACGPRPHDDRETAAPAADVAYADIASLQAAIKRGDATPASIVAATIARIEEIDDAGPRLNAVVEINEHALQRAQALNRHAETDQPLYGVPFLIKANIDAPRSLATHAGSAALAARIAPDAAHIVQLLQAAGAVLVGSANLSEWANFRSTRSISGWSSVGGQTRNPHVLDRNPCGSSSGSAVAVAAGMVPLALGTETQGSIVCPAGVNGVVGVKPTLGLVSREGIVPIAAAFDTAGPITRNVRDAALALQVMSARPAATDVGDPAMLDHPGRLEFSTALDDKALNGKVIGVWRAYPGAAEHPRVAAILDATVVHIESAGARLVDPVGLYLERDVFEASFEVMLAQFSSGLRSYAGHAFTLREIIEFNQTHADRTMPWFGQDILERARDEASTFDEDAALEASRTRVQRVLSGLFDKFKLDAIVAPTNAPAWRTDVIHGDRFTLTSAIAAAVSGRPAVTLPAGDIRGLPVGVSLIGKQWRDVELLALAYALEQRLPPPPVPRFLSTLDE